METTYYTVLSTIAQVVAAFAAIGISVVLVKLSGIDQSLTRMMDQIMTGSNDAVELQEYRAKLKFKQFIEFVKNPANGIQHQARHNPWFEHLLDLRSRLTRALWHAVKVTAWTCAICVVGIVAGKWALEFFGSGITFVLVGWVVGDALALFHIYSDLIKRALEPQ